MLFRTGLLLAATAASIVHAQDAALTNIAQFYEFAKTGYHGRRAVLLEGVVVWVEPNSRRFVLVDETGAVPVSPGVDAPRVHEGQRLRTEGHCSALRSGLVSILVPPLLVDNDSLHNPREKAASIHLKPGLQSIRLGWFNSQGNGTLRVWYEGPNLPRQLIPNEVLFHLSTTNLSPGLTYRCSEGDWNFVPDFDRVHTASTGVVANFDITVATRLPSVGLEFAGLLKIKEEGRYTFYTQSDDGSLLSIDDSQLKLTPLGDGSSPPPARITIGQQLSEKEAFEWAEIEGTVTLVREGQKNLQLELASGEDHVLVELGDGSRCASKILSGARIRATGICQAFGSPEGLRTPGVLWVPGCEHVQRLERASARPQQPEGGDAGVLPTLTTINQVRGLSSAAANRQYPVRLRGVVTGHFATGMSLVIQDEDEGIYVSIQLGNVRGFIEVGDACEVEGNTRFGAFAPMIDAVRVVRLGPGRLPEPLRPALDQILNGSLDSQYVEIEGLVTGVDEAGVRMLTRVGRLELDLGGKSAHEWSPFEDAVVRIRGCMLAVYDRTTGLVTSGKIRLVEPWITVDIPASQDPFFIEPKTIAGLRSFNPRASVFERVKVCGQIVHAQDGLFCLTDGTNGLRFFPKNHSGLRGGTQAEVAGILDLTGASPVLLEAFVRPLGAGPLLPPRDLSENHLLSSVHNATRVRLESFLVNSRREPSNHVFELRTGNYLYAARLHTNRGAVAPVPVGSLVAVSGVYLGEGGNWAFGRDIQQFSLVLNSPADLKVLARPSWWTARRLLAMLGALAVVLLLALAWIWVLRKQVESRTRLLAEQIQARQQVEQQRAIEHERSRLARDLHDDLGGGLTEISLLGSLARDPGLASERKAGFLDQLTDRARQLVTTLDEIVWAVNPRYDSIPSLAEYYSLYGQRFLGLASLACHLEIPETLPDWPLESKVRHSLFLAFKEALNNVVRHARATEVWLRIAVEAGDLIVSVADNGCGLSSAPLGSGMDGLPNMRARMQALGGRCEIRSSPDGGTAVLFSLNVSPTKI